MATTAPPAPPEREYVDERPPSRIGVFFRSYRPERKGTLPAGLVLVIMAGALLVATLLNANSTYRKSVAKDKGEWRQTVAAGVQDVACKLRLTVPHDRIDEALGRPSGCPGAADATLDTRTADQILADDQAEQAKQQAASGTPTTPTTAIPDKPTIRTPTAAAPLNVWVGGDSVAGSFAPGLQRVGTATKLFNSDIDFKVSSGLTRQDFYNWPLHLRDVAKQRNPDVMVVMFGANDSQPIANGDHPLKEFSAEWLAEYRKRVGSTMDLMKSPTNNRLVVWIGQPVMSPKSSAIGMDKLDYIFWDEARTRPWVVYFDAWPYFTDDQGGYTQRLPMADGKDQKVRENDGVHLTPQGADRLAWVVFGKMATYVDVSANQTPPPLGALPPASVKERTEVPKPPDWPS